jgi:hypothetical protein
MADDDRIAGAKAPRAILAGTFDESEWLRR